ncbi:TIGR04279 domain-containing protein [Methanohalophilus sp. RSK]|uniref:TIGR04279 domain-containing protein n=1 Tax=Methanohalophilus sp. RSK TaxID=2485783 RepID=UPI000F43AD4F|nr:TIGR04279 domain-containing protein [Methanohalophilus sp. RSK]RNI15738.1 TIGR04279 domain-containing protein [Methanohalophilus sp. RSK]
MRSKGLKAFCYTFIVTLLLIGLGSIAVADSYEGNITINDASIGFANHTSSDTEGNWIAVKGGEEFRLPHPISFTYQGINATDFNYGSTPINITMDADDDYAVTYPFANHSMFTDIPGQNDVELEFYGSDMFANDDVELYIINVNRGVISDINQNLKDADLASIHDLTENAYKKYPNEQLDGNGDLEITCNDLQAGDYMALMLLNTSQMQEYDAFILSATGFEVLEYDSVITASPAVNLDKNINVDVSLLNAANDTSYTYGAVLVKDSVYKADIEMQCNGSRDSTNLTVNEIPLIQGCNLLGIDSSNIDRNDAQNKIIEMIGPDNGTIIMKTVEADQTSLSITTTDLPEDKYVLLTGVYKSGEGLVAFGQQDVFIAPYNPYDINENYTIEMEELSVCIDDFFVGDLSIVEISEFVTYYLSGVEYYRI